MPDIQFLILRHSKPPVAANPERMVRAGWSGAVGAGAHDYFFKDTDEIAPGVKLKFLGYGDQFAADGEAVHGALIAVSVTSPPLVQEPDI